MNFKANHNFLFRHEFSPWDVCYLAKIWILKQITTKWRIRTEVTGCLLSCKDMNFKANHNITGENMKTDFRCLLSCKDMNFKANHNPLRVGLVAPTRCLLSCKDMNFKANHNGIVSPLSWSLDVCYLAKIWILKQITTDYYRLSDWQEMFVILQRYEF